MKKQIDYKIIFLFYPIIISIFFELFFFFTREITYKNNPSLSNIKTYVSVFNIIISTIINPIVIGFISEILGRLYNRVTYILISILVLLSVFVIKYIGFRISTGYELASYDTLALYITSITCLVIYIISYIIKYFVAKIH